MKIIDTSDRMLSSFASGRFELSDWEAYMDASVPGAKELCLDDMREVVAAGWSWEKDFLPVLDAVRLDPAGREEARRSFHAVTERLDERVAARFGRSPDAALILYLGLCSGAGWVTALDGKAAVLFGIEKILELGWQGREAMTGLVLHELGHVYQAQFGVLERDCPALPDQFLWQLFTEGVAMVFEQEILGESGRFHQYDGEWKSWCDAHAALIRDSFARDMETMTHENQRYFGDWVRFEGRGDTGYYLGARFVRFLLLSDDFDRIISYGLPELKDGFARFLRADL